ncbi:MAG: polyprenyl diphosphate synthase [Patescibacteria group bacterium]
MTHTTSIPQHIAIIMDGNRRWAKQHKLQALQGHQYVTEKVIEPLVDACVEFGVPYLTLWAFSTENWKRDQSEVEGLMKLFRRAFAKSVQDLHKKGVRLNYIGDLTKFPKDIQESVAEWIEISKNNTKITVTFALNYGGQDEILRAIKKAAQNGEELQNITAAEFSQYLDTNTIPDPDLLIRPGGEQRLSGYLPWQSVYAELYFTDILMPDFGREELHKAIEEYGNRWRRFGK